MNRSANDYSVPEFSSCPWKWKAEKELVREKGQVVEQTKNGEGDREKIHYDCDAINLFMPEYNEMTSWIPYPLDDTPLDRDFFADLLGTTPEPKIQSPPIPKPEERLQNFAHFSRLPSRAPAEPEQVPKSSAVDSNSTPPKSRSAPGTSSGGTGSGSGAAAELPRKRKAGETDDVDLDCRSEEVAEAHKRSGGSRSRSAQVHNLSERRRRDRINEKMKALQQLIPCCNKVDKASMLDEAIQYLKSLQMQVQMMSMICGMVPAMCPGMPTPMPFAPYGPMMPAPAMGKFTFVPPFHMSVTTSSMVSNQQPSMSQQRSQTDATKPNISR